MKAPLIWLKDITDIPVSAKELGAKMSMTGLKAEEIITTGDEISGVYTGRITEVADHPDSDHLKVLKVDLGSETLGRDLQIVCGAANVTEGMICPVAVEGARLPEQHIKKGKLRGVESFGMCCSRDELGISGEDGEDNEEFGLWSLPQDTPVGVDIKEIMGLGNTVIDFETSPERPDCLTMEGIAREAAAALGLPFTAKVPELKEEGRDVGADEIKTVILERELCYRMCLRIAEDVTVESSAGSISERLVLAGETSVNNIVDICNYVCLELGIFVIPFDLEKITGKRLFVRRAKEGEAARLADGQDVTLCPDDIVIADDSKICAIGGICGCEGAAVSSDTKNVVLAACALNGDAVAVTSSRLHLDTVYSRRSCKGPDPENTARALDRVCELIEKTGCGKICRGMTDMYPVRIPPRRIAFDPGRINAFIGIDADAGYMKKILADLGCAFEDGFVIPPSYRSDLRFEADIAGEVARFYGYGNIKPSLLSGTATTKGGLSEEQKTAGKMCDTLVACGFCEAVTYPFEDEEKTVLRETMLPSMIHIAALNDSCGNHDAKIFEMGCVYAHGNGGKDAALVKKELAGFYYSNLAEVSPSDVFYETKGALEELMAVLGISSASFETLADDPSYHPGRTAAIMVNGKKAGVIGFLHPDLAANYECPAKTCFFEIDAKALITAARTKRVYKQLPKYSGIEMTMSVTVPGKTAVGDVIRSCRSSGGKYLREVEFVDVIEDEGNGDSKDVSVSLFFRDDEKPLTEADVKPSFDKIVEKIEKQFGGKLK